MNYLLGLQTMMSPGEIREDKVALSNLLPGHKGQGAEDDALLALLQQGKEKKSSAWNQLFPSGMPTPGQCPLPMPANPNAAPETLGALSKVQSATKPLVPNPATLLTTAQAKAGSKGDAAAALDALNVAQGNAKASPTQPRFSVTTAGPEMAVAPAPIQAPGTPAARSQALKRYEDGGAATKVARHADPKSAPSVKSELASFEIKSQPTQANVAPATAADRERKPSGDAPATGAELGALTAGMNTTAGAALQTEATASAHASERATVPQAMQHVETLVHQGGGKMTIELTPPHLGKVEIEVTTRGKKVEIALRPESVEAKSALEQGLNDLRQQLHGHDLILTRTEVHVARETAPQLNASGFQASSGGQFSQSHAFSGDARGGNSQGQSGNHHGDSSRSVSSINEAPSRAPVRVNDGRVDLRI